LHTEQLPSCAQVIEPFSLHVQVLQSSLYVSPSSSDLPFWVQTSLLQPSAHSDTTKIKKALRITVEL
jgi:hypothetical protein